MFYRFAYRLLTPIFALFFRMRIKGREHVPKGGALLCCNHSSNFDPIFVALGLPIKDPPSFMAKFELFANPLLRWLITAFGAFPVERGKNDLGAIKTTLKLLKEGKKVLMFPEGTRLKLEETAAAKQGAAMLALKAGVPLVPMYITKGRKRLFGRTDVVFGQPFTVQSTEGQSREQLYEQTVARLMTDIYALKS